ncbi:hypothetical protein EKO27_g10395 [Xylaria grammica]|uniref:Aldehyde dehydrogenase domain-containing protein n=1 Tax=Xylaria grammica TaxID=363999 RepID=A0A439CRH6_9PEZI|nr:hypothetical protein EKO27_g10395 [Xylaria grammica]
MPSPSKRAFTRLQETVTDGRLGNSFFRREQLYRLYNGLQQESVAIQDATVRDSGNTPAEALVQLHMAFSIVKSLHNQIKPNEDLEVEYRVSKAQDARDYRIGVGIVVISPQEHTFLYSVLAPLSAAIAAGNAVIVVIENSLRVLPPLITKLLRESLDPGIFETVSTKAEDESINVVYVNQNGAADGGKSNTLDSPSSSLTIAIVDRSADIEEAAESLINARFAFNGTSPYAPDVVLVNEFAKKEFLRAVLKHALEHLTEDCDGEAERPARHRRSRNEVTTEGLTQKGFQTLISRSNGDVVEIADRNVLAKLSKVREKRLFVHSFSSLEDAIEVANGLESGRSLAAYAFADWKTCKYLLQFLDADIGLANIVPLEILVGPALPRGHDADISTRYRANLFNRPRQLYSKKPTLTLELEEILKAPNITAQKSIIARHWKLDQREPVTHILGYFERGLILGSIAVFLPVVLGLGTVLYYAVRQPVLL